MTELLSPRDGARISLLTAPIREFIKRSADGAHGAYVNDADDWEQYYPWIPIERDRTRNLTAPAHVLFRWISDGALPPLGIEISEDPGFTAPARVTRGPVRESAEDGSYFADAYNFKTGTRYFWRVVYRDGVSGSRSFETEPGIRAVEIPGCSNVRDLGGLSPRIRQGLVYRGCALDPCEEEQYEITEEGRRIFADDLGIKTQIDLRGEIGQTLFADGPVEVVKIPFHSYSASAEEEGIERMKTLFDILADPGRYPVYINCQAGADRTGTAMFYLEAALGLPYELIVLDYDLSSLSAADQRCWELNCNVAGLLGSLGGDFPGLSVPDALVARLLSIGIEREKIEKIRDVLLI